MASTYTELIKIMFDIQTKESTGKSAHEIITELKTDLSKLSSAGVAPTLSDLTKFEKTMQRTLGSTMKYAKYIKTVEAEISALGVTTTTATKKTDDFGTKMLSLASKLDAVKFEVLGISAAVFSFSKDLVNTASDFEQYKLRLYAVTKDMARAEKLLSEFKTLAMTSPFDVKELTQAGVTITVYADGLKKIRDESGKVGVSVEEATKEVANLASAMGKDVPDAALAFGRATKGSTFAFRILRDSYGITTEELEKFGARVEKNKLILYGHADGVDRARQALWDLMKYKYGDVLKVQGWSAQTAFANVTDAITNLKAEMGEQFLPALKKVAEGINFLIGKDEHSMLRGISQILGYIIGIGGSLVATIVGVTAAVTALGTAVNALNVISVAFGITLKTLSWQVAAVTLLITAIIGGFMAWSKAQEEAKYAQIKHDDSLKVAKKVLDEYNESLRERLKREKDLREVTSSIPYDGKEKGIEFLYYKKFRQTVGGNYLDPFSLNKQGVKDIYADMVKKGIRQGEVGEAIRSLRDEIAIAEKEYKEAEKRSIESPFISAREQARKDMDSLQGKIDFLSNSFKQLMAIKKEYNQTEYLHNEKVKKLEESNMLIRKEEYNLVKQYKDTMGLSSVEELAYGKVIHDLNKNKYSQKEKELFMNQAIHELEKKRIFTTQVLGEGAAATLEAKTEYAKTEKALASQEKAVFNEKKKQWNEELKAIVDIANEKKRSFKIVEEGTKSLYKLNGKILTEYPGYKAPVSELTGAKSDYLYAQTQLGGQKAATGVYRQGILDLDTEYSKIQNKIKKLQEAKTPYIPGVGITNQTYKFLTGQDFKGFIDEKAIAKNKQEISELENKLIEIKTKRGILYKDKVKSIDEETKLEQQLDQKRRKYVEDEINYNVKKHTIELTNLYERQNLEKILNNTHLNSLDDYVQRYMDNANIEKRARLQALQDSLKNEQITEDVRRKNMEEIAQLNQQINVKDVKAATEGILQYVEIQTKSTTFEEQKIKFIDEAIRKTKELISQGKNQNDIQKTLVNLEEQRLAVLTKSKEKAKSLYETLFDEYYKLTHTEGEVAMFELEKKFAGYQKILDEYKENPEYNKSAAREMEDMMKGSYDLEKKNLLVQSANALKNSADDLSKAADALYEAGTGSFKFVGNTLLQTIDQMASGFSSLFSSTGTGGKVNMNSEGKVVMSPDGKVRVKPSGLNRATSGIMGDVKQAAQKALSIGDIISQTVNVSGQSINIDTGNSSNNNQKGSFNNNQSNFYAMKDIAYYVINQA